MGFGIVQSVGLSRDNTILKPVPILNTMENKICKHDKKTRDLINKKFKEQFDSDPPLPPLHSPFPPGKPLKSAKK